MTIVELIVYDRIHIGTSFYGTVSTTTLIKVVAFLKGKNSLIKTPHRMMSGTTMKKIICLLKRLDGSKSLNQSRMKLHGPTAGKLILFKQKLNWSRMPLHVRMAGKEIMLKQKLNPSRLKLNVLMGGTKIRLKQSLNPSLMKQNGPMDGNHYAKYPVYLRLFSSFLRKQKRRAP